MTLQELVQSIDVRLADFEHEISQLQGARHALVNDTARAPVPSKPTPVRRARRVRKKLSKPAPVEVVPAGKLEVLLSKSDGLSTADLAKQANADRDQVLVLLREMEQAGSVRRSGQRRSTRWHAITDEDRITKRAAELAARSRKASNTS